MRRSAAAAGESGSASTIGAPASPPSRSRVSSGIWPSSGTGAPSAVDSESATAWPPPEPNTSMRVPSGSSIHDMFSTTPTRRWRVCSAIAPARSATSAAACCGVVTTSSSAFGIELRDGDRDVAGAGRQVEQQDVEVAPVDVGEELLQRAVQHRAAPDHGVLPGVNMPIEMTFTPCACGGMIMLSTWVGRSVGAEHARHGVAVDVGVDHADRQARARPSRRPG